ncbi:MAG: 1-(5-phosphoribosyl)-5-[Firmicutes bacterium]|nr:1-(5-phosphoribosyl)-5-[(5-phosphoribosylamino)methylideneamino]imidazole-4-carboxamide isomerase [Bacillota bacterium]
MTELFPAIDMRGGSVVRLLQGDYEKMTVYNDSPLDMAYLFDDLGVKHLHLVDLDGAKDGRSEAINVARAIVNGTSLAVEIGGGIRTENDICDFLSLGVDRVILGTVAVTDPDFTMRMLETYGPGIAIGLDIRDGFCAIHGWKELSRFSLGEAIDLLAGAGAETFIVTDISRDGAMRGIDDGFYRRLVETYGAKYGCRFVASGGVTDLADIRRLAGFGLEGIITGRAIYDGRIDLAEALTLLREIG